MVPPRLSHPLTWAAGGAPRRLGPVRAGIALPFALLPLLLSGCPSQPHPAPLVRPPPRVRPAAPPLRLEVIPSPLYAGAILTMRGEYAQLLFHLNLHNRGPRPLSVEELELAFVRDNNVMQRIVLSRPLLAGRLRPVPWIVMRDRQSIAAAHRLWRSLPAAKGDTRIAAGDSVSLVQQFTVLRQVYLPDELRCRARVGMTWVELRVPVLRYRQRTVLRLPVQGRWWVMAGHRFDEYHGHAFMNSQNFAYDLGKLGGNLSTFDGEGHKNEHYRAYAAPIRAAAAGRVVEVYDGMLDNRPVGRRPHWQEVQREPRALAGNYVVLEHGEGEFSAYLHLRRGVPVKAGQVVEAGQVVGYCGNSGNSSEPHLHFQLQDAPDPLRARGLPARFSDFTLYLGRLRLYVPPELSVPLPSWLPVEPGKATGAVPIERWLKQQ